MDGKAPHRPNSRKNLDLALQRLVGRDAYVSARTVLANAIVAQMLPNGAVKGGSAIKLRLGNSGTRFTTDLDAARASDLSPFIERLAESLAAGWEGFTGRIVEKEPATPAGIPAAYVMRPYEIKLAYNTKPWVTVPFELGHNEIGDADSPDYVEPKDANETLMKLGFPPIGPIPVMPLEHQMAQKLHAASAPESDRAHDLIDLQLIAGAYAGDWSSVRATCLRLFAYRRAQTWPPTIHLGEHWEELYASQLPPSLPIRTAHEAVTWANELIQRIDAA